MKLNPNVSQAKSLVIDPKNLKNQNSIEESENDDSASGEDDDHEPGQSEESK